MARPPRRHPFVVQLMRKIRHHTDMRWRHVKDDEKRNYHDRWRAACEKELAEWLEDHKQ